MRNKENSFSLFEFFVFPQILQNSFTGDAVHGIVENKAVIHRFLRCTFQHSLNGLGTIDSASPRSHQSLYNLNLQLIIRGKQHAPAKKLICTRRCAGYIDRISRPNTEPECGTCSFFAFKPDFSAKQFDASRRQCKSQSSTAVSSG